MRYNRGMIETLQPLAPELWATLSAPEPAPLWRGGGGSGLHASLGPATEPSRSQRSRSQRRAGCWEKRAMASHVLQAMTRPLAIAAVLGTVFGSGIAGFAARPEPA